MNLLELKKRIDAVLSTERIPADEIEVVIPNNKPAVGPTSATTVKSAGKGFDWNRGRFFIKPEVDMVEMEDVSLLDRIKELKHPFCKFCDTHDEYDEGIWRDCGCVTDGYNNAIEDVIKLINGDKK